ncbi:MAG: heme A synthase [Chloroflexaceae bacterium]|nr:heme A synthase [Chloroflexaceae bacterium]NJL34197.1 heme A synthase [Chloroflexaceae bacterium]NJO04206.1 heme A synthase [Chloroflexaceae bacterium]
MKHIRLFWFASATLLYTLGVILWGAFVRATGSGAGCGSHWPLCNGEIIPRAPQVATLIEFGHRITSGLALVLVVVLFIWALRVLPRGDMGRRGTWWVLFFMITESLVGAALVLMELVGDNSSVHRAIWMAAHLVNTFFLMGALTLTCWWLAGGGRLYIRRHGLLSAGLGLGLFGLLWLGMSGAIAALGNTLYPSASLLHGLQQDFSPTAHVLIRLRIFHPLIAAVVGIYILGLAVFIDYRVLTMRSMRLVRSLVMLFGIQVLVGIVNVALLAPVWLQVTHLLLANLIWIVIMLLTAEALSQPATLPEHTRVGIFARPNRTRVRTR